MRRFASILKWSALGGAVLLLCAVFGVTLYTRTENFQRWLRQEAVNAVNQSIRGALSIDRLEGSVWRHLTLYGVALHYEDDEIARIPRLDISFALIPLLWKEVRISAIDAAQPRLHLSQDAEGKWNVAEALSPRQPEPLSQSALVVLLNSLRLKDGSVNLQLAADKTVYRLERVNLEGGAEIRPAAMRIDLRALSSG
ncbi:MAG: AsmA family protein, partial [Candidatus Binatia bacterium]